LVPSFDCIGAETNAGVTCSPAECESYCKSKGYKDGICRGGGVVPEYCMCIKLYTNFMGKKGGKGEGDVDDGGGEALFLEDEATIP